MDFRSGCGVGAKAPTPVTVRLAPQCARPAAAGRTTSFRRLSLRRRLVCRAGQSSRTKDGRQSCPTRRERARPSKEPTNGKKPPPHQATQVAGARPRHDPPTPRGAPHWYLRHIRTIASYYYYYLASLILQVPSSRFFRQTPPILTFY